MPMPHVTLVQLEHWVCWRVVIGGWAAFTLNGESVIACAAKLAKHLGTLEGGLF